MARKKKVVVHPLDVKSWAITGAVLWGFYLFLAPIFAMQGWIGYWFSKPAFLLLQSIYPGLTPCIKGAFIGLAYGLVCGAICAGLFAGLHNFVQKCACKK